MRIFILLATVVAITFPTAHGQTHVTAPRICLADAYGAINNSTNRVLADYAHELFASVADNADIAYFQGPCAREGVLNIAPSIVVGLSPATELTDQTVSVTMHIHEYVPNLSNAYRIAYTTSRSVKPATSQEAVETIFSTALTTHTTLHANASMEEALFAARQEHLFHLLEFLIPWGENQPAREREDLTRATTPAADACDRQRPTQKWTRCSGHGFCIRRAIPPPPSAGVCRHRPETSPPPYRPVPHLPLHWLVP